MTVSRPDTVMNLSLRHRLVAVVLLATVAFCAALFAIERLAKSSTEQRVERARDAVAREVDRLRDSPGTPRPRRPHGWNEPEGFRLFSGYSDGETRRFGGRGGAGPNTREAIAEAVAASRQSGETAFVERSVSSGVLVAGAAPLPGGGSAWAVARVSTPRGLESWRAGVLVLALACLLLVAASVHTLVAFERGTTSLRASLSTLARDLRAPVARPGLRELGEVADGIATLASGLAGAQAEQERLTGQLAERERLASLGRVAAGVAHEVRNPLAAIKLRVDLAQRAPETPTGLARDLADISAEVTRLDRLVADLLAVAGRRLGPRVPTDLGAFARQRVALLLPWAEEHAVSLTVTGTAHASVDPDALARALDNLLRNAVEASPAGAEVAVELETEGAQARLSVRDRGTGVPPERAAELFEPFFTTKPEGTGLGLALSRAIATAHGGTLSYHREDGTTRFALALPRDA